MIERDAAIFVENSDEAFVKSTFVDRNLSSALTFRLLADLSPFIFKIASGAEW